MKTDLKKTLVYLIIAILLVNIVVFALKLISIVLFWAIIIVFAIIAYSGFFNKKAR